MGSIRKPPKVRLICGLLYPDDDLRIECERLLTERLGPILEMSDEKQFSHTDYYTKEMGAGLNRRYYVFERFLVLDDLSDVKIFTNEIEDRFCVDGHRTVNIDPGYVDLAKLVLASTKDFSHRIYIGKGIYAEVTLSFRGNSFTSLPTTYPDYKDEDAVFFFNRVRQDFYKIVRNGKAV